LRLAAASTPQPCAALLKLGAKPGTVAGHAGLVWGAEGSLHLNNLGSSGQGFGSLGEYDRTVLGADLVVAGRRSAQVADLLGAGGATFASNPVMVATVDCLGDVVAAYGTGFHGAELAVGARPAPRPRQSRLFARSRRAAPEGPMRMPRVFALR
jgi:hypothetical protein